jgi:hypothetical protein
MSNVTQFSLPHFFVFLYEKNMLLPVSYLYNRKSIVR